MNLYIHKLCKYIYIGNPMAAAIAKTSIEVLFEENMIENSRV